MKSASAHSAGVSATVIKLAPRGREEIEFLPAALEVVERPPSPTGRAMLYAVSALCALTLAWAAIGKVDIVAVASGRIVPSGNSKVVQPLETAIVTAIHVRDGQSVKSGETLIELDTTASIAETRKQLAELTAARLDAARLRALETDFNQAERRFEPPADAAAEQIAVQRKLLASQVAAHAAKLGAIDGQMQQRQAEQATIRATIAKLEASIPLIRARFDIRDEMSRKQLGSKIVHLENKQALVESEKELLVQQSHLKTADAALAVLGQQKAEASAEFHKTVAADLAEAERKVAALREEVAKARQRTRQLSLTAPIDGTVQQLSVHSIGGVVTSAQSVLVVVPHDARLEIEAMVSNRDIGFVRIGQEAQIKIEAFDFTRYGLVHGRVEGVSRDAIVRGTSDRDADRGRSGDTKGSGDQRSQDLAFAARIALHRTSLDVEGVAVPLTPGMATTVEIKTGSRTILSYLLSPIARYRHDAMSER